MERVAWTDERLDDLARRMDAGFDRVDHDIRELRTELRTEIGALRTVMTRFGIGLVLALIGVIATMIGGFAALLANSP
jgi:hypothetical protein